MWSNGRICFGLVVNVLLMLSETFEHVQIAVAAIIPLADKCPACPSVFQTVLHPMPFFTLFFLFSFSTFSLSLSLSFIYPSSPSLLQLFVLSLLPLSLSLKFLVLSLFSLFHLCVLSPPFFILFSPSFCSIFFILCLSSLYLLW